MIVGIDGDLIAYRCAASCEKQGVVTEDLGIAQMRAHDLMHRVVTQHSADYEHQVFLTGKNNFRKTINPEYKANRKDQVPPRWLGELKQWLVDEWKAVESDGVEADDLLGIEQTKHGDNYIIATLDKDLRQVPGWHYSWEISGTSSLGNIWVRPEEKLYVSPMEGLFNFYWQMMMGDASDNIFGYDGKARAKVPKFMEDFYHEMQTMETEEELFSFVRDKYNDDERFLMNGACLWILRSEGDSWQGRVQSLMVENGLRGDSTPSSPQHLGQEPDDGLPSMSA